MAGWDVDRYEIIAAWPLREALLAFVEWTKREDRRHYEFQWSLYMHGRQLKEEPTVPHSIDG